MLDNCLYLKAEEHLHMFMTGGSFLSSSKGLTKVTSYPPAEKQQRSALSQGVYISKRWLPGPGEDIPGS